MLAEFLLLELEIGSGFQYIFVYSVILSIDYIDQLTYLLHKFSSFLLYAFMVNDIWRENSIIRPSITLSRSLYFTTYFLG